VTSWRDEASLKAQKDLDSLLDAGLGFAQEQLAKRREFYPFARIVTISGELAPLPVDPGLGERPASNDVIAACIATLVERRQEIRGAAIIAAVALPDGDAIRVELEHSEGVAITVWLPYAQIPQRNAFEYGDLRAASATARLWKQP
jgi:hypothetical protein